MMGVVVGMLVGLVGIWNSIKARQRETKQDIETAIVRSEGRLKEFFEVKLKVVDTQTVAINQRLDRQLGDLKDQIITTEKTYHGKLDDRSRFFSEWLERVEREAGITSQRLIKKEEPTYE
jgi:hypothetical protein